MQNVFFQPERHPVPDRPDNIRWHVWQPDIGKIQYFFRT